MFVDFHGIPGLLSPPHPWPISSYISMMLEKAAYILEIPAQMLTVEKA